MTAPIPGDGFRIATGFLEVVADDAKARRQTDRFLRDTDRKFAAGGRRSGRSFGEGLFVGFRKFAVGLFDWIKKLFGAATTLIKFGLIGGVVGSAVAGIGSAIASLVPALAELVHVAVAAAGSLLLIPGALVAGIALLATAIIGFRGFSDAVKAAATGNEEALSKLAPAMAATARAVAALKPAFTNLRLQVQQALFAKLANTVKALAATWLPMLTEQLAGMGTVLGGVIADSLGFLAEESTALDWSFILAASALAVDNLGQALRPLLRIVTDVTAVSSEMFAILTGGAAAAVTRWADSITDMRNDGTLAKLITDGLDALKQFGALLVDVGGIFRGIFTAGGAGGFFAFFDRLNKLINSATGQAALSSIFDSLAEAGVALTPVLVALLKALVPVAQGLATISVAFGPALTVFVTALGTALASLAPGFVALGPVLEMLSESLQPLATILVGLVVGLAPSVVEVLRILSDVLSGLAPIAEPVGKALGLLLLTISDLAMILAPLVTDGLSLLADVLIQILEPLEPIVRELFPLWAEVIHNVFDAFKGPVMAAVLNFMMTWVELILQNQDQIIVFWTQLGGIITTLATLFAGEFVQALDDITPMLPMLVEQGLQLVQAFSQLLITLLPLMPYLVQLLGTIGQSRLIVPLLTLTLWQMTAALKVVNAYFEVMIGVATFVGQKIADLIGWFRGAKETVDVSFGEAGAIIAGFGARFAAVKDQIVSYVDMLVARFWSIRDNIGAAIADFPGLLWEAGRNLIFGLADGIRSAIPHLSGIMGWIADMVRNYWPFSPAKIGPLSGAGDLKFAGANLVDRLGEGMRGARSGLADQAADLAGLFAFNGPSAAGAGGMSVSTGPTHVTVMLGNRIIDDAVQDVIVSRPEMVASAADEGHQTRGFRSSRNRLVQR